jgi:hypothetical protein
MFQTDWPVANNISVAFFFNNFPDFCAALLPASLLIEGIVL